MGTLMIDVERRHVTTTAALHATMTALLRRRHATTIAARRNCLATTTVVHSPAMATTTRLALVPAAHLRHVVTAAAATARS